MVGRFLFGREVGVDGAASLEAGPGATPAAYPREAYQYCTNPMCGKAEGLENHHIVLRSQGGGNEPENKVFLCGDCHRRRHEEKLQVETVPEGVRFTDKETGETALFTRAPHVAVAPDLALFAEAQAVERWFDIRGFAQRLKPMSREELIEFHGLLRELYRRLWVLTAGVVSELHSRTNYSTEGEVQLAKDLAVARATVYRRSRLFRELLEGGKKDPAPELVEETWYWMALATPEPQKWLDRAAAKKAEDPRFSIRDFRDLLAGEKLLAPRKKQEPQGDLTSTCCRGIPGCACQVCQHEPVPEHAP